MVVVAARISAAAATRLRAVAAARGKRVSDVLRDTIERAMRRAA